MKKNDTGLSFKAAINGFNKDDVNDYIANMKYDFQRILDEKEDELSIFKNLNAKMSETNNEALDEKERQMGYLSVKISGLTTQLENLENQYKSDLEKFEIIKMNMEKELNEKSGLNRFEIDQIKNDMVTEIEQLQKEITQNRMELNHMDEVYRNLQQEKAIIEDEKYRLESEKLRLEEEITRLTEEKTKLAEDKIQLEEEKIDLAVENNRLVMALGESQNQLSQQGASTPAPVAAPAPVISVMTAQPVSSDERAEIEKMQAEISRQKDALVNVLMAAQKQADELLADAKVKSELLLEEAKTNASTIVYEAKCEQIRFEEHAKVLLNEAKMKAAEEIFRAETIVTNEREKLTAIRREIKDVRDGIIQKLDSYKDGLDQLVVLETDKEKVVIPMRECHG